MAKHASELPAQPEEKKLFTEEDVQKIVAEERKRQFMMDDSRIHGNAFFAEALDHISTLGARDPFWKRVYQFGMMFKNQFEINSGQAAPASQQTAAPAAKEKPASKKPATPVVDEASSDDATSDEEQ